MRHHHNDLEGIINTVLRETLIAESENRGNPHRNYVKVAKRGWVFVYMESILRKLKRRKTKFEIWHWTRGEV